MSPAPVPRSAPGWLGAAVLIVVLGAASTLMQLALNGLRDGLLDGEVAQLRAIGDIQGSIADSHLWMEEFVSGDAVSHGEIWAGIERSRALAGAMLAGDGEPAGIYPVRALEDATLRAALESLAAGVEHFAAIARARETAYRSGASVGVGTPTDAAYDRTFHALIAQAQALRGQIEQRMAASRERAELLSRAILAGWVLMVAIAFAGFARLELRRAAIARELRARDLQLSQASKLEAVGRLASGLAHDINNYLAAIIAQSELVRRKPPAPGDAEAIERLRTRMDDVIGTANRAATLMRRLLMFTRQQAVNAEVVELGRLVVDMQPLMRQLLGNAIELELELATEPWNTSVDPSQVEQVLVNLLVNARDAMPRGGKVRVATRKLQLAAPDAARGRIALAPGDYVELVVADQGDGIPAEIQAQVFEPFFSTKPRADNSGLGLATVYSIVQQAGGGISLDSVPGRGTTFRIQWPRSLSAAAAAPARSSMRAPEGRERVLLIEDNAALRAPMCMQLESLGYEVLAAGDGVEALALLRDSPAPDVVVTDVVMPRMGGAEAAARVRELHGAVPVLFMSGQGEAAHGELAPASVRQAFLQKPFPAETLAHELRALLDAH